MRLLRSLKRDERGAALVEFAIVAPVLCLLLVGGFDTAHTLYTRATLQGIVQKTARDSGLQDSSDPAVQAQIDDKVKRQVSAMANNATITITRRFYRTFTDAAAAQAETWTDTNANGRCDAGEPYVDENNNSTWDQDGGDEGQGGANDKTVYTVKISYPRMFPLWKFIGVPSTVNQTAKTILMNQPYADQNTYTNTTTVRNCT